MLNPIIFKVAFRNIFLYKMKTLIVGSIIIFGAFLAVLGNSIVNAIADGMKNSLTQSVTGDLQIYGKDSKDKLSVFGNMDGSPSDLSPVQNFKEIKSQLLKIQNVKAVVPMGANYAMMNPGNLIDVEVEKLRLMFKTKADFKEIQDAKNHLKFLIEDIQQSQLDKVESFLILPQEDMEKNRASLNAALADTFWKGFDEAFENRLEFISNKIAPLLVDENMLYFSYLGTDPDSFKKNFEQFEIVKGEMIPTGQKGFLIHDYVYETMVKHRIARRFDAIKKEIEEKKIKIKDSKELQDKINGNQEQLAEIYLQLNPSQTELLKKKLQGFLGTKEENFKALLALFFQIDDESFKERFTFFYANIAPEIQLYKIKVGDVIPLTAFTKLGSSAAQNIKVWGTFRFKSFENSPLAGNFSLIDMVSFRQLYGFLTESRKKQNQEIESEMGVSDFSRDDIEALFTDSKPSRNEPSLSEKGLLKVEAELNQDQNIKTDFFNPDEIEAGVFLNAAVFLKDPRRLSETTEEIQRLISNQGLNLQLADWEEASGMIGQMTFALKFLLYLFVFILLSIASLMIMNSLLMATMDRQQEIGTMRAIGAPKKFIYQVFIVETGLTSLLFGGIGTLLALAVVYTVGVQGIPAQGDVAAFFFSGPKLYFQVQWYEVLFVFIMMLFIAFVSTQYPAWKAMKISPILAMQKKD